MGISENLTNLIFHNFLCKRQAHKKAQPDVVVHACNPSTQKAEARRSKVQSLPGLNSKIMSKKIQGLGVVLSGRTLY
jgi:hypothetical protein